MTGTFHQLILSGAVLLAAVALPNASQGDELADQGRKIFNDHRQAVVTVKAVIKMKMNIPGAGGQNNESKSDVTGTVIQPDGLTVISLSSVEPNNLIESILGGAEIGGMKMSMDSEITDLKILLEDGSEIPAAIVLRDKDLDLAFIRPKTKPAAPMVFVDLANSGSAELLDEVIALNRLGVAANRAYSASVERISAIVEKPRKFYLPDSTMTATAQGSPAFTLDGKALGIFVLRAVKSSGGGFMGMNFNPGNFSSIIIPATNVQRGAEQAPEVKDNDAK